MATLHVRNVPDVLYEWLRARADEQGRSIGSEAVAILQEACAGQLPRDLPLLRGRIRRSKAVWGRPWERMSSETRGTIATAYEEARELGHDHLGTEHVLLALARGGPAARILAALGIAPAAVRAEVERRVERGEAAPTGQIPFGAPLKKALELAVREALALGHDYVGPEHLLVGLAAEGENTAAQVLSDLGTNAGAIRGHAIVEVARGLALPEQAGEQYRTVPLSGSADDWTDALNSAAGDGYELVSVVQTGGEPRAVFRRPTE